MGAYPFDFRVGGVFLNVLAWELQRIPGGKGRGKTITIRSMTSQTRYGTNTKNIQK